MKLSSIEYISENDYQEVIIEKNNNKLSPISLSILDSVLDKKITIIFSQGPLNLTPIISCLFAFQKQQDVVIGIPKTLFKESFEKNERIYFSLLYKKKINSIASDSLYFYFDMLWCKGEIDEEANQLKELSISTRPKRGKSTYKDDFDKYARDRLTDGTFQKIPKIVSIPIESSSPAGIIGEKSIKFKNEDYKLNNFNPKLIIYDSINERNYSFDNIIELINKTEKMDIKLVLHFSWPYLKGLSAFLNKISKENNNVNVLHLGKRFCIESRNNFEKPPSDILPLSLEGRLWDIYYPNSLFLNFKVILPASNINRKNLAVKDIEYWDWPFDEKVKEIQEHLKYESLDKLEENTLRFPPIIDTFLCPSEIKRRTFLRENKSWISLPINESVSVTVGEISHAVREFTGLCLDVERCRDLSYELMGLCTNSGVTKKTLLQSFLIDKITNQFRDQSQKSAIESDKILTTSIVIANLFPYLGTQTSLVESLNYLVKSIANIVNSLELPYVLNKENTLYLEKESDNNEKSKEIIWKDKSIQEVNISKIKKLFLCNNSKVEVSATKENNKHFEITVEINTPTEYLEYSQQSSTISRKYFKVPVLYKATIRNDGSFNEYKLSNISFERKLKNSILKFEGEYRSDKINKKTVKNEIQIIYTELSKMQNLPRELIQNSELLIPGPIPFHTISEEDILISHGYDALLLPFKNIVFSAYPGTNFKKLLKQIKLYNDLLSENQTRISRRDLLFSLDYTKNVHRFNLPHRPSLNDIPEEGNEGDTPIDTTIRQELLDDSNTDENEREEIRTLRDIWAQIQKKPLKSSSTTSFKHKPSKEQIDFCVEFGTGAREIISFPVGMLIRKKIGDAYILSPIEELSEEDTIIYIQTDERESIENYLRRNIFSEDKMSLEDILEPLTALKLFYDLLKSLGIQYLYDETKMAKLYWLSPDEKEKLFNLFTLLCKDSSHLEEVSTLLTFSIWQGAVKAEKLNEIFSVGNRTITYRKLYYLAVELGLKNYKEDSFKGLCSTAINEQKHYSFHDENNLLALGRLIGHQGIIGDYQIINEKGSKIRTFLQQVGFSIKRVADGRGDPFNEIDLAIEGKMKKCKIVKLGGC